ncbi:MAG: hypothetical protein K8S14_07870 [Actinomycetia bacterium]|nr:hypothetical protein [Actinomycetes bacterium]
MQQLGYVTGRNIENIRLHIGKGALIGAGSVVTKDIPAYSVTYGNPARVVESAEELPCPFDKVERPYINSFDVHTREEAKRS